MAPNAVSFKNAHISTRLSLRWLPEDPFENTDTLVLMVGEWYVDLRVDKQSGALDWAIAGQCLLKDINPRMSRAPMSPRDQLVWLTASRPSGLYPRHRLVQQLQRERPVSLCFSRQRGRSGDGLDGSTGHAGCAGDRLRGSLAISAGYFGVSKVRSTSCLDRRVGRW